MMVFVVVVVAAGGACGSSSDGHGAMFAGDACAGLDLSLVPAGVSTLAGGGAMGFANGCGAGAAFDNPVNVLVTPGGTMLIADRNNGAVRTLSPGGVVTTFAAPLVYPFALAVTPAGDVVVGGDDGTMRRLSGSGVPTVLATGLGLVRGLVALADGSFVVSALTTHVLWRVAPDGQESILAGSPGQAGLVDGFGAAARFNQPVDIVVMPDGALAVADLGNDRIRRVTVDGTVTTLAGIGGGYRDGALAVAAFDGPSGLALDADGSLFVSDRFNHRIRRIDPAGQVTTVAGSGVAGADDATAPLLASFASMEGIDIDTAAHVLYVADGDAGQPGPFHRVRRLSTQPLPLGGPN